MPQYIKTVTKGEITRVAIVQDGTNTLNSVTVYGIVKNWAPRDDEKLSAIPAGRFRDIAGKRNSPDRKIPASAP